MFREINTTKIFFEEPEREFHLREIARIFKKNPVTIKKRLDELIKKDILSLKKIGKFYFYSSNVTNENYKELKRQYNREKLLNSGLIEYLKDKFNLPTMIIFGSFEKGEDNKNSDIDMCLLTETKKEINTDKYEKVLKRKIQLHLFSDKEFKNLRLRNKGLFENIINGYKIYGFLEID